LRKLAAGDGTRHSSTEMLFKHNRAARMPARIMSRLARLHSGLVSLGFLNFSYLLSLILAAFALNGFHSFRSFEADTYLDAAFQDASRLISFIWPYFAIAVLTSCLFQFQQSLDRFVVRTSVLMVAFFVLFLQIGAVHNWPLILSTLTICLVVDASMIQVRKRLTL